MLEFARITTVWADNAAVLNTLSRPTNAAQYTDLISLIEYITDATNDLEYGPLAGLLELALFYAGDWETQQNSLPDSTAPCDVLELLMQQHGLTQGDLERAGIARQTVISQVLSGERQISKGMARKLATHFQVKPAVFL